MSAFLQAQADVKTLTQRPSNDDMLALYGLFKQASEGDASGKRPGVFDMIARAKYDAWAGQQGMSQAAAEQAYIDKVDALLKSQGLR